MKSAASVLTVAGALLALATAGPVGAADAPESTSEPQAVRAVRDKETGLLRGPTQAELKSIVDAESAARRARGQRDAGQRAPLRVQQHPDGMRSAVLGPEYLMSLKARRRPDGGLVMSHGDPADGSAAVAPQSPTE